jgi:hypothetical protein
MLDTLVPPVLGCWLSRVGGPVFRELSVAEQRYPAVLAVCPDGMPHPGVPLKPP